MKNHQIYHSFNFCGIVLVGHKKNTQKCFPNFFPFFSSLLSNNPIYFFTTEAVLLKWWQCVYNYVLCAMIIFCYLSITVGYFFYHISAFSSKIDNYMFTYLLYFIIMIIYNISYCTHTYILMLYH